MLNHRAASLCLAALASIVALPVLAAEDEKTELDKVQVIGTRVPLRTLHDSAVPVDIVTAEDLKRSGFTDLSTALESITPSFNFAETTISDGSDHVKPATLRGLGPDQVLVLINGKRRHNSALIHIYTVGKGSAGTDLNAIPIASVERIEVLRDGASAQYGSDAIAGVINIVLKRSEGTTVGLEGSQTSRGDGTSVTVAANSGIDIGAGGVANFTLEVKDKDYFNRAAADPAGGTWRIGEPALEQFSLWLNAERSFGQKEFYAFGGHSQREGEAAGFFRYPFPGGDVPFEQSTIYPNGFLPLINSNVIDDSFAVGLRFPLGEWNADLSVATGRNSFEFIVTNSINFSYGLGPTGLAADVPTSANAGELAFAQTTFNFDLSKSVSWGEQDWALALGVEYRDENYTITAGDQYSWDYYGAQPWGVLGETPGIQVFPGWSPAQATDASRNDTALYVEASTELSDDWRIELALRGENYSDFGTATSMKLASFYELSPSSKLRGSISTGFRAPALQQYEYSQIFSDFALGSNVIRGIFAHGSPIVVALDIPALDPETSLSFTFGAALQPADDVDLTIDVYQIDIKDRIAISGTFAQGMDPSLDTILIAASVDSAAFFTNAVDTQTRGVDLVLNFHDRLASGARIDYVAALGWNATEVVGVNTPPGALATLGLEAVYFDRKEQARIEDYQPNLRVMGGATYKADAWEFGALANYYDEIRTVNDATDPTYDFVEDARWIFDASVQYDFGGGFTLRGGINNLLDEMPDGDPTGWDGPALPWSLENSQWGLAGRTYYLRAAYTF